ncbi:hypothetical protein N9S42_00860 [Paracoccaceae bacterium]|jgi:hypothetical protein|nr:hypothetical protein [Paracoccaceae bacterium]
MRRAFVLVIFAYISLFTLSPTLAQENSSSISSTSSLNGAAALAGTIPQVGVTFGGVSIASVAIAATLIVSLLAFALEDNNTTSSSTSTN